MGSAWGAQRRSWQVQKIQEIEVQTIKRESDPRPEGRSSSVTDGTAWWARGSAKLGGIKAAVPVEFPAKQQFASLPTLTDGWKLGNSRPELRDAPSLAGLFPLSACPDRLPLLVCRRLAQLVRALP